MTNTQTMMTEKEAASLLAISIRTLQAWRVSGGGPRFMKLGRAVRYGRNEVEAWAAARAVASTSETSRAVAAAGAR